MPQEPLLSMLAAVLQGLQCQTVTLQSTGANCQSCAMHHPASRTWRLQIAESACCLWSNHNTPLRTSGLRMRGPVTVLIWCLCALHCTALDSIALQGTAQAPTSSIPPAELDNTNSGTLLACLHTQPDNTTDAQRFRRLCCANTCMHAHLDLFHQTF